MNRAVVVLLLLIANAIVSYIKTQPPKQTRQVRLDHSLGIFAVVDGVSLPPRQSDPLACQRETLRRLREFDDIRL